MSSRSILATLLWLAAACASDKKSSNEPPAEQGSGGTPAAKAPAPTGQGGTGGLTSPSGSGGQVAATGGSLAAGGTAGAGSGGNSGSDGPSRSTDVARTADAAPVPTESGATIIYVGSGFYSGPSFVVAYRFDPSKGELAEIQKLESAQSPSFMAVAPKKNFLYVNVESDATAAAAYSIDPATGMLKSVNQVRTGQKGSAYISIDKDGRYLFQANYSSGSVVVLGIKADGSVGDVLQTLSHGAMTFPHCIRPDPSNQFVFVPNRTGQSVSLYKLDAATGKLTANSPAEIRAPAGTGPRHIDFHPALPIAYVINESASTLTVYKLDRTAGTLTALQTAPTLPDGARGATADLHIAPNGKWIYGVNRGHNSLAIFKIDETTGMVTPAGHQITGAGSSRNFVFDPSGKFLILGSIETDEVIVFAADADTGKLQRTGSAKLAKPSGIAALALPKN